MSGTAVYIVRESTLGSNNYQVCLTDGTIGYLKSIEGCGFPQNHRIHESSPNLPYPTDLGYRLDTREITIHLWLNGTSLLDMQTRERFLLQVLAPSTFDISLATNLDLPVLQFVNDSGQGYRIQAQCTKLDIGSTHQKGWLQEAILTFSCPDPIFYDVTPTSLVLGSGSSGTMTNTGTYQDANLLVYLNGGGPSSPGLGGVAPIANLTRDVSVGEKGKIKTGSAMTVTSSYYVLVDCTPSIRTATQYSPGGGFVANVTYGLDTTCDLIHFVTHPNMFGYPATTSQYFSNSTSCKVEIVSYPKYLAIGV